MTNPFCDPYLVLSKVYGGGAYLKQALADTPMEEANRARTVKISYGVLENDGYFNDCIRAFAPKSPKLPVRILLKISLYLLLFMNKPRYMITDNAVELCKKLGKGGAAGFLNAFLRAFDAEKVPVPADKIAVLAQKYSYPAYAVRRLLKEYGDEAEKILAFRENKACVRFACSQEEENVLARGGEKTPFDHVYRFSSFRRGEGYDEGKYTFQSIGSIAVCDAVEPAERFLDACAAPGGKSLTLAEAMQDKGQLVSGEFVPARVPLLQQAFDRCGITCAVAVENDATQHNSDWPTFDRVLCDVPCSGLGVIAKKPDIRYKDLDGIENLLAAQQKILQNGADSLAENGRLVYSTCTVNDKENQAQVEKFLSANPDFHVVLPKTALPGADITPLGTLFLPHRTGTDGFFAAILERN